MKKPAALRQKALDILSRRDISRAELAQKLRRYAQQHGGAESGSETDCESEIAALLDDLAQRHWLCDSRFAENYIDSRKHRHGARRLRQELQHKGVSADTISRFLPSPEEEFQSALNVLRKKSPQAPADAAARRRCLNFLAYRGFSPDICRRALRAAWPDADGSDEQEYAPCD